MQRLFDYCLLKLARTITDLEGVSDMQGHHIAEALQYRARQHLA